MTPPNNPIHLLGQIGKALFNSRLQRDAQLQRGRALMVYPQPSPEEDQNILGVASLLNQLHSPALLQHPKLPVILAATPDCSARQVYLFTCGDHNQSYLTLLYKAIKTNDILLELGAGLGLGSILAMKAGATRALAVEPNPLMLQAIHRNADANRVEVEVLQGCVVPGQTQGETTFYVVEEAWASNIFDHRAEERTTAVDVPVVNVSALVEKHQPQVLALDIQGAELGLFKKLPLGGVRDIVVVTHTPLIGEKATAETLADITRAGFTLQNMAGWAFHFSR